MGGAYRVATVPLSPTPSAAPAPGQTVVRCLRRVLHPAPHVGGPVRPNDAWHALGGELRAWAGEAWRETFGLALFEGLDAFHLLGPHGVLLVLETSGLYRAGLVDLELPPANELPEPSGPAAGFDPLPDELEVAMPDVRHPLGLRDRAMPDVRLVALVTNDARCLLPVTPLTLADTAEYPYAWDLATDPQPLTPAYLARLAGAAWRGEPAPSALDPLPSARAAFKRYLLSFVRERLGASLDLLEREAAVWEDDSAYAGRLDELWQVLDLGEAQFGDVLRGIAAARNEAYRNIGPATIYDPELHKALPSAAFHQQKIVVDRAFDRAVTAIEIARARFQVQASLDERGAVGLLTREDAYDGATRRAAPDARQRARERLAQLIATARARLAEVQAELDEVLPDHGRLYTELLGAQPVVDVALQWGFGLAVQYEDALTGDESWSVWAPIPDERVAAFQAELLAALIGEHQGLEDYEVALLVASIAILVTGGVAGIAFGSLLIPAVATALTMGLDGIELYVKYDRIVDRARLVHAVHGLPGYRDPELVQSFTLTAVLMSVSWLFDVKDVARIGRAFAKGIVSLDHRFALLPWLRRDVKELAERARTGWDAAALAARADAIQAASAGARFTNAAEADAWAAALAQPLESAGTFAAGTGPFLSGIEARGGWVALEEKLAQLGASNALESLEQGRKRVLENALVGHAVDQLDPGRARSWTVTSAGDLQAGLARMQALRADLTARVGPAWEHRLGLSAHLVVSTADRAQAVQTLRDLWPAGWPPPALGAPPGLAPAAAGELNAFATTLVDGFGGWSALAKQLDDSLDAVQALNALRNEELFPLLANAFTIRKGGSASIASDLDVSVMFEVGDTGIAARMEGVRNFMQAATGLDQPRAWRNAFDMELFVDPSLATFYERLPKRGLAFVLADHVFSRAARLTELMREGDELLLGFDLLAEYARREPFPDDLLAARFAAGGAVRSARDTGDALLAKLDEALGEYDTRLAEHAMGLATDGQLLDQARRVSDTALAVAMNNDEAYFLAGATKTVMSIRDGASLYKGLDVSLERLTRLHVEELRQTFDENWLAHVVPDLARVFDEPGFGALPLGERSARLAKAAFRLGKYGNLRAVGLIGDFGSELGAAPALVARASELMQLGAGLKQLRASAAPERLLAALGELGQDELLLLHARRVLRDAPGPGLEQLSAADRAVFETGELSPARLVERTEAALRARVQELVGPGMVLSPAGGVFPPESLLGQIGATLAGAASEPLLSHQRWVASRVALRLMRALPLLGSEPAQLGPLELDLAASALDERLLGVTPPPDAPLDPADLEHLGLDGPWMDPK